MVEIARCFFRVDSVFDTCYEHYYIYIYCLNNRHGGGGEYKNTEVHRLRLVCIFCVNNFEMLNNLSELL